MLVTKQHKTYNGVVNYIYMSKIKEGIYEYLKLRISNQDKIILSY